MKTFPALAADKTQTLNRAFARSREAVASTFHDVKCLFLILKHPDTPSSVKCLLFLPVAYLCSPIQLLPSFIPVVGQLDDLFVIWLTNRLVQRFVSEEVRQKCCERAVAVSVRSMFRNLKLGQIRDSDAQRHESSFESHTPQGVAPHA